MSKDASALGRKQRDDEDQNRDCKVYRYLLAKSDLSMSGKSLTPNETSLAKQWGVSDNRIFIRRVLRSVLYDEFSAYREKSKQPPPVPGLTLSRLVSILSALQDYQQEQQSLTDAPPGSQIITRSEKLRALQLFFELSPDERSHLDLPMHPGEDLLNQILEKATDRTIHYTKESSRLLYRYFLRQLGEGSSRSLAETLEASEDTRQDFISREIAQYIKPYLKGLSIQEKNEHNADFTKRVEREIDRIALQAGLEQANNFPQPVDTTSEEDRVLRYLPTDFVKRLIHSVIDNELITDEFPIYIKYFDIERIKPLPLHIKQRAEDRDYKPFGLLNALLLQDSKGDDSVQGLERQVAYRVKVHFYIKLPKDYQTRFEGLTTTTEIFGQQRLNFSEEVTGIGCPTSHITSAINRVLFWDIPALNGYTPIADGIHCNDELMGSSPGSPVWSHCVVRLYKSDDIDRALASGETLEAVSAKAEVASADFCGFDWLETTAKAALHARLKLIKQILANQPTVSASDYITQLCNRVEEMLALRQAKECLSHYPFSLRAMEGKLESTIFNQKYRTRKQGYQFEELIPGKCWSVVALDAQLSIAEANLKEGLLHIARQYLEVIRPYFEGGPENQFSDLLQTRYHLCWFRYYYLGDLKDPITKYPDRYVAVRKAEEKLEEAETRLQERLNKYEKLDELPQSNLHPQFYLLSRIYAHRAKLYIFFSNYMHKMERWETLLAPVKLLEKARIYAARDGDPALYAQWTAYQSWCYIMLAYLSKPESFAQKDFSCEECLDWAHRLIEHASICYSATGKVCYQQIKDGGGQITPYYYAPKSSLTENPADDEDENILPPTESPADDEDENIRRPTESSKYYEKYGSTLVEVIPLIQELLQNESQARQQGYQAPSHVATLDVSLLKERGRDEASSIYLFGMQSAFLLFAKGMLLLCQKYTTDDELIRVIRTKSLRMFDHCYAVSSDGTQRNTDQSRWPLGTDSESIILDRFIPKETASNSWQSNDQLLRCLYPNRITQFADLSTMFIVVCKLILLIKETSVGKANSKTTQEKPSQGANEIAAIREAIKVLRENKHFPFPLSETCGQERYNGHLAEHYVQFEKCIEGYLLKMQKREFKGIRLTQVRQRLVIDVFKVIRGEPTSLA
ncbi:MAG: hypothetical protein HC800_20435 [Phormidesmis sp. RL_2_1]|nr:hypothetical protein [Phormidesmis sp. RL_2_1]